jgi:hypothetical protein
MNIHFHRSFLPVIVLVFVALSSCGFAQQAGVWDFFEINAQYRGGMKKGFESLGCSLGYFANLGGGKHQVILHSCVQHPEHQKDYYAFRINLVVDAVQNTVTTTQEMYSWFDKFEPQHQSQVKDIIILLALLKNGMLGNDNRKFSLQINKTNLEIESVILSGGKRQEITTVRSGNPQLTGKFFLKKNADGTMTLEKFHLRREKISVSFVNAPLAKIQAKFQNKSPFDKVVFAK